jgi:hypothetical protein
VTLVLVAAALRPFAASAADPAVTIRVLTAEEATEAIVDDSTEPYFAVLQPLEMAAKTGATMTGKNLEAQRDECRRRYQKACREFSADEKAGLEAVAKAVSNGLRAKYPLFAQTPWSFLKIADTIEGGMPHTRGPHIVLTESTASMFAVAGKVKTPLGGTHSAALLVHEQCHVMQRARPALFADLYTKVWNLVHAAPIAHQPPLAATRVVNPDGPDMNWVFVAKEGEKAAYWQPLIVLADKPLPRMPDDFGIVAVALEKQGDAFAQQKGADGKPVTKPLDQIDAYTKAFGAIPENFHPNETFAVLFSALVCEEELGARKALLPRLPKEDVDKFRAWCREHLAAPAAK